MLIEVADDWDAPFSPPEGSSRTPRRCAAKNWVRVERQTARRGRGTRAVLVRRIEEAFDAVPGSLTLTAPES
ncbi:hypothetical protein ABT324_02885 [Saccharopolyspora sp. NPDC000359]|uniref:hypothetical protein n=1 Tax=Saccharopolyspora sp. NPDC000359 TaxID=3154251 RepID=UPI003316B4C1